ncbi:MAG: hypothetical protein NDI91_07070 [Sulfuritalea sp.]|nr:hypothetical protein [Sulfuritalea sp.]
MIDDHSNRWHIKALGWTSIAIGWLGTLVLFVLSLWSVLGEYLVSALVYIYMLFGLIDAYRKYGLRQMLAPGPLGRNYYIFGFATLIISTIVNLVVYLRLLAG